MDRFNKLTGWLFVTYRIGDTVQCKIIFLGNEPVEVNENGRIQFRIQWRRSFGASVLAARWDIKGNGWDSVFPCRIYFNRPAVRVYDPDNKLEGDYEVAAFRTLEEAKALAKKLQLSVT